MFIIFLLKNYGCILKENNEMAIVEVHHSNGSLDNSNDVNTKPSTSKESCGITIDKQANSNNVGTVEEDNKNKRENITGEVVYYTTDIIPFPARLIKNCYSKLDFIGSDIQLNSLFFKFKFFN